jgi:hypothetical protein
MNGAYSEVIAASDRDRNALFANLPPIAHRIRRRDA